MAYSFAQRAAIQGLIRQANPFGDREQAYEPLKGAKHLPAMCFAWS